MRCSSWQQARSSQETSPHSYIPDTSTYPKKQNRNWKNRLLPIEKYFGLKFLPVKFNKTVETIWKFSSTVSTTICLTTGRIHQQEAIASGVKGTGWWKLWIQRISRILWRRTTLGRSIRLVKNKMECSEPSELNVRWFLLKFTQSCYWKLRFLLHRRNFSRISTVTICAGEVIFWELCNLKVSFEKLTNCFGSDFFVAYRNEYTGFRKNTAISLYPH
jgi:hypothetical protein